MIASLPMYDWPEQSAHWDRFWAAARDSLRDHGIDAPDRLTRSDALDDIWQCPALLLGQTCGLPFRTRLLDKVTLVGAFDFGLPGCAPGFYNSVIVVPKDGPDSFAEAATGMMTYSMPDSQSGWAALYAHAEARRVSFDRGVQSGAHRLSARLVATGSAGLAAIDAETWRLIEIHEPRTATALKVIDRTVPTPGLPLIAHHGADRSTLVSAIRAALSGLDVETRTALHLKGFVTFADADYLAVPNPPAPPPD